jgi:PHP family Zn ribbon phosphoesterase
VIELSILNFSLLVEGVLILLVILILWVIINLKTKKRDRAAASLLVEHIKHQSKTRTETTSSYLHEKYLLEGDVLKQTVKSIDDSEKKFFQKLINIYLNRDAKGLSVIDASVAEMIDIYKSLTPVIPIVDVDAEVSAAVAEKEQQLEALQETNAKLSDELGITKETLSSMVGEFGNMFGGGHEHGMDKDEVFKKMTGEQELELQNSDKQSIEQADSIEIDMSGDVDELEKLPPNDQLQSEVSSKDKVDDLLNSIDLADDKS